MESSHRIVNAMDKSTTIANLALTFERGLKAAGYDPVNKLIPLPPVTRPTPVTVPRRTWWERIKAFFAGE